MFIDQRWEKYLINPIEKDPKSYWSGYAQYVCRTWNHGHTGNDQLMRFDAMFMLDEIALPGTPKKQPAPIILWSHKCFPGIVLPLPPTE